MPPKKTRAPRRPRKMGVKKARKIVTKERKTKAKKNMDTFFLRAKTQTTLKPVQGGAVANYVYQHFPLMDATSPIAVTQIPEFNLYRVQYDKVRINSIHVVVTPKANVLDQAIGQADAQYNVTGSGVVHTCVDRDGPAPSNVAAIERYPSYKKFSVMKKFARQYSIKWPINEWLDCQNIYASDLSLKGCKGGITIYGENFLEDNYELLNEPWAQVEVYYNVVFQGKTSASLSVDATTGAVTLTPHEVFTNLPYSGLGTGTQTTLSGSVVTYDNSGNQITISDRGDHSSPSML